MTAENWLQLYVRSGNALKIMRVLRERPQRKIDLSRATGLSRPTIDKYIKALQISNEVYGRDRVFYLSGKGVSKLERLDLLKKLFQLKRPIDISMFEGYKAAAEIKISAAVVGSSFIKEVESLSGQRVLSCYNCGKCSAGCPTSSLMDIHPHQIIRLIQLGQEEEVLSSRTIWLCSSCFTCASRCPRGINITAVMEALRVLILRRGVDRVSPSKIPSTLLAEAPQLALVSCFRKLTS